MIKKIVFILFSLALLVYMLLPGTNSILNFQALPHSVKSSLSGDTYQIPNISAFFSNNYRDVVIPFYKSLYGKKNPFFIPPIELNYPPEDAYKAIKDQTQSTYLEEFVYPLRDSVFVNGLEPFTKDGTERYWGAGKFLADDGNSYYTKVTLRYYPSSVVVRLLVWVGIVSSSYFLAKLSKEVLSFKNA